MSHSNLIAYSLAFSPSLRYELFFKTKSILEKTSSKLLPSQIIPVSLSLIASDAIKDKETGIICDGNNLDEIYSSIDLVLKNNSYKELGKKAKDYVTKFEWNNIVSEYLKIL